MRPTGVACGSKIIFAGGGHQDLYTHVLGSDIKIIDVYDRNTETKVWIDFALKCGYIGIDKHLNLYQQSEEFGKLLSFMIDNPKKFIWNS